jgi:hypothetical protein
MVNNRRDGTRRADPESDNRRDGDSGRRDLESAMPDVPQPVDGGFKLKLILGVSILSFGLIAFHCFYEVWIARGNAQAVSPMEKLPSLFQEKLEKMQAAFEEKLQTAFTGMDEKLEKIQEDVQRSLSYEWDGEDDEDFLDESETGDDGKDLSGGDGAGAPQNPGDDAASTGDLTQKTGGDAASK